MDRGKLKYIYQYNRLNETYSLKGNEAKVYSYFVQLLFIHITKKDDGYSMHDDNGSVTWEFIAQKFFHSRFMLFYRANTKFFYENYIRPNLGISERTFYNILSSLKEKKLIFASSESEVRDSVEKTKDEYCRNICGGDYWDEDEEFIEELRGYETDSIEDKGGSFESLTDNNGYIFNPQFSDDAIFLRMDFGAIISENKPSKIYLTTGLTNQEDKLFSYIANKISFYKKIGKKMYESVETISENIGLSAKQTRVYMSSLKKKGYIIKEYGKPIELAR